MVEAKSGYRQTEVGLIPEDWEVILLDDNCDKIGSGITPTGGASIYESSGRPFVRSQNIGWGDLRLSDITFISEDIHSTFPNTEIKLRDVFLNISGASIGRSSYASEKLVGGNVNQHVCIIRTKSKFLNAIFLNKILLSTIGQKQIESFQSGGNREGLNIGQIKTFKIPLPPTLTEQKAIAQALSDVDELIKTLTKTIEKKKAIKQGAMQALLTPPLKGGKRLSGFDGEWEELNLGKTSVLKARIGWQGLTTDEYLSNGNYYLVTGTDFSNGKINWNNCVFVEKERYIQDKNIQLKKNDILVTKDGTIGKVAFIDNVIKPTTLNSGVFVIRPKMNSYNSRFLYFILMSRYFKDFLEQLTAGSTISHLYQKDFVFFNFHCPIDLKEQQAIAQILTDMDEEIQNLETKKTKYKTVKQGMMQELLTGKTRLI